MKKVLFCLLLFPIIAFAELSVDQLSEKTKGITVEVYGDLKPKEGESYSEGTFRVHGFFINETGLVLTYKSFLEDKKNVRIFWTDTKGAFHETPAEVVTNHPELDIALLKINPSKETRVCKPDLQYEPVSLDSYVFLSGLDLEIGKNYPIMGKVIEKSKYRNIDEVVTGIPRFQGGEGAPVFNTDGSVIGINHVFYSKERGKMVAFIPLKDLKGWLSNHTK